MLSWFQADGDFQVPGARLAAGATSEMFRVFVCRHAIEHRYAATCWVGFCSCILVPPAFLVCLFFGLICRHET